MFVCCECCVLPGRGFCDGLITRPEESYRLWCVVVCDLEKPQEWGGHSPRLGCKRHKKKNCWYLVKHSDQQSVCYTQGHNDNNCNILQPFLWTDMPSEVNSFLFQSESMTFRKQYFLNLNHFCEKVINALWFTSLHPRSQSQHQTTAIFTLVTELCTLRSSLTSASLRTWRICFVHLLNTLWESASRYFSH